MNLFIVIVSYNSKETLVELLDDLVREKFSTSSNNKINVEIVVVENGEGKNFKFQISNFKLKIIENNRNLGFAKGTNIGIKYALANGADKILLLNPDTSIEEPILPKLLESNKDIVSPVIKFKRKDKWVYDFGGKVNWKIGRTYHIESTNYSYSSSECNESRRSSRQARTINIDYVSGCCMLIKRKVFEKIGFFDERFFLYFEDVDFCIRAKKAGFRIGVESKSVIVHDLVEGDERSVFKKYQLLRSNAVFINKYLGFYRLLGYLYLLLLASKMML